jgi:cytoskeletal protein CcmA (bactofilin family)
MVFKSKKSVFDVGSPGGELPGRAPQRDGAIPSVISAEMTLHGDVQSPGDVQVEGRVIGQIKVNRLILAAGAAITGDIIAKEVRICGTLKGTIRSKMVTLTQSGRVVGDIFHELLSIETGGQLEGKCHRLGAGGEGSQTGAAAADAEGDMLDKPGEMVPRIYANGRNRNAAA